jgi:hypothetical protein
VAYQTDSGIVCTDCVKDTEDCSANEIIEYSAGEIAGDDGLWCDRCGKEIVEPAPRCETCEELEGDCTCDSEDDNNETEDSDA